MVFVLWINTSVSCRSGGVEAKILNDFKMSRIYFDSASKWIGKMHRCIAQMSFEKLLGLCDILRDLLACKILENGMGMCVRADCAEFYIPIKMDDFIPRECEVIIIARVVHNAQLLHTLRTICVTHHFGNNMFSQA